MTTPSICTLWRGLCATALVAASTHAAAVTYNITTLPGTTATQTAQVFGINNSGQIAGLFASNAATGNQQAFIYSAGAFTPLSGPAGALGASAFAISDAGLVVGSFYNTREVDPATGESVKGPDQGFIFNGTSYLSLNAPGAVTTQLRAVSPNGRYVSGYSTDSAGAAKGFVFDRNTSTFTNVGGPNSLFTIAQGVNDAGVVVGSDQLSPAAGLQRRVGFTYNLATSTRTDYSFAGYSRTSFRGIDASGRLAGWLNGTDAAGMPTTVGFVGTPSSFEVFTVPGAATTFVQSINNAGVLVGSYADAAGLSYAFVATPVPEPQTVVLMLTGLAGLVWRRRAHALVKR
jgi:uncharacterized membrane protein